MSNLVEAVHRGDLNAMCAQLVPDDQLRCERLVPLAHARITDAALAKARAQIASKPIATSGNVASWVNATGGREEATYYNGRWLFHLAGGTPSGESAPEAGTSQGGGPAAESRPEEPPQREGNVEPDRSLKLQVRTMQTAIETYATDHNASYVGATLQSLELIEPTLSNHQIATPAVEAAAEKEYAISSTGTASGEAFKIARLANGELVRRCQPAGHGSCPENGLW